jgi:archaellum biogenesis ATPase FlaH
VSAAPVRLVDPAGHPYAALNEPTLQIGDLPSVWQMDAKEEWLVDGMIPRRSVNLISAESGTGKTWLAYALAGAVAHGASFIGQKVQQTPVLYLDGENPLRVVQRNLRDLGIKETPELNIWAGWNVESPPAPDDPRIISFAREFQPLLIWDSLVEFAKCDEQSSNEVRAFMKKFRHLAHDGATVIVLHHTGKSQGSKQYRGSSDIKASVDMAYVVTGSDKQGKLHRLTMTPFKSRIAPGQTFAMEFREGRGFVGIDAPKQAAKPDPVEIVRRIVIDHPKTNATRIKELAKPLGVSKGKVDEILGSEEFFFEPGKGAEKLYWVEEAVAVVPLGEHIAS